MSYWKGLMLAVAIDVAWIMGCPAATDPGVVDRADSVTRTHAVRERPVVRRISEETARMILVRDREDSLMTRLQEHPDDVTAMEKLAHVYLENGWYEPALRPLARALQLDHSRRSLWVALDAAIEKSGRGTITDAELTQKALEFKEAVELWGHGC